MPKDLYSMKKGFEVHPHFSNWQTKNNIIMKKIIFTMLFSAIHFTMFAQLSINANGNVTIGHYEDVDEPNLQVGNVYPSNNKYEDSVIHF